jgi:hypothetical protein
MREYKFIKKTSCSQDKYIITVVIYFLFISLFFIQRSQDKYIITVVIYFLFISLFFIQHCFICLPSDSTMLVDGL